MYQMPLIDSQQAPASLRGRNISISVPPIPISVPPIPIPAINPRTAGGLSHLRTAGGGADDRPPRELENKER